MEPPRKTIDDLMTVQDELIRREPIFHRPELGTSREAFESMTAEDFWETGASGRRYSRDFILETVLKRYSEDYKDEWRTDDFYCQMLAKDLYLLTYTLNQGKRVTRRATLWQFTDGHWVALYHQGTVVEGSEQEPQGNS